MSVICNLCGDFMTFKEQLDDLTVIYICLNCGRKCGFKKGKKIIMEDERVTKGGVKK